MYMNNLYLPIRAEIKEVAEESASIKSYVIVPDEPLRFEAGQFVELTVPGVGEAPFTPSSSHYVTNRFELTVMEIGAVTKAIHAMEAGGVVGVRGPYGSAYPLDVFEGKEIIICGGGVGLAPLRSLLLTLHHDIERYKKILLRYGARTPPDIIYKKELADWQKDEKLDVLVTVDEGDDRWKGRVGLVTTILEGAVTDAHDSVAVVCGPPVMMKFTTFKLLDLGFAPQNIYLSMEKNMSCGIGKCGHCRLGDYYVCKDGPVFTYDQIKDFRGIWE
jgi:sulfite reductase subunit B